MKHVSWKKLKIKKQLIFFIVSDIFIHYLLIQYYSCLKEKKREEEKRGIMFLNFLTLKINKSIT